MKKILFLLVAAVCVLAACEPVQENISNDGHITIDELKAKSTVTVDKAASGKNGNVISCSTSAPVNAKWNIGGKEFIGNFAKKKMKVEKDENGVLKDTNYKVFLTALCADGTELKDSFQVSCQEITDPLEKFYIYGDPANADQAPFVLGAGDAAAGRFSDSEGKYLPYLSDDVYFGLKTLIFDITDAQDGDHIWGAGFGPAQMRVMTGWWDPVFADGIEPKVGLWELPITEDMAKACAKGGNSRDLDLLMTRGSITIKSVYYEE